MSAGRPPTPPRAAGSARRGLLSRALGRSATARAVALLPALLGAVSCPAASGEPATPAASGGPSEATARRPTAGAQGSTRVGLEALRYPDALEVPIAGTVYSLPAAYLDPGRAEALLRAARELSPERELIALVDPPMARVLGDSADDLRVHLVPTGDRLFTPWPRDPFSVVQDPEGGLVLVDRPDLQRGREEDAGMARTLLEGMPAALAERWGGVRLERSALPFHNGHVLMADGAAWISLHSLEPRILEILGLDRVPAETFGTATGIDRYLAAADRAIEDFAAFYGKPVRLVHPLPRSGPPPERTATMREIGGGGPFDLDSLVTFLPSEGEGLRALVGDPEAGLELLAGLGPEGWRALEATYGIGGAGGRAGRASAPLLDFQTGERAEWLGRFLDLVADHLAGAGVAVDRLPLVVVPTRLLPDPDAYQSPRFLLGWNNVVVEVRDGRTTAEGFSSGIPSADAKAREIYAAAGAELELLPPLVGSVTGGGGYRCASNQVRIRP